MRALAPLFWLLLVFPVNPARTPKEGEPPWEAAKAAIEAWYQKELPDSKVEEIVPAENREILNFGLTVRHHARVRVRRADRLCDRDHVAVTPSC